MNNDTSRAERLAWFRDARLGMFVHWGMYSVLGRGEQIMWRDLMPLSEYQALADRFRPRQGWARRLAQTAAEAGMKYITLTTRHHDGYCLFDTAAHDFNAVKTGPGRDLVAEYVEAAREAGLRIGLYYSILDWRWPGTWSPRRHPDDLSRMVALIHTQVRELLSHYGKIDLLWYDCARLPGAPGHGLWGGDPIDQTSAEFFRAEELDALARELQPQILINNRSGVPGDFGTPEQKIRSEGNDRPWETCMTLNYAPNWGYLRHSMADKTAGEVLYNLLDAVRLGGNFMFNVGPDAEGSVSEREKPVLRAVGAWLRRHGEAVYGTRPEGIYNLALEHCQGPMFQYGMWTCKGSTGYLTLLYYPADPVVVSKLTPAVTSATLLTTGQELTLEKAANGRTLIRGLPDAPPDPLAPVIKVEFEGPPQAVTEFDSRWLDGSFDPSMPA